MARPIIVSNGEMAVGLNRFGMLHDLYFPYVGLENHCSERAPRHRVGLFVDGTIHWLDDESWGIEQRYFSGRLIGKTVATNPWLGFSIEFQDFVDADMNVFARNIEIINLTDRPRQAKLFLHQAFIISEASDGHDTVQYVPSSSDEAEAILHYKGRRAFAISGYNPQTGVSFDSYSVGHFGRFGGKNYAGAWRDAEDGKLERNPVDRFQTDSILEFRFELAPHDSARVHYFLAAGKSTSEARKTLERFRCEGLVERLFVTDGFWKRWLGPAKAIAEVQVSPRYRANFLNSLMLLKAMMDRRGAIIASIDSGMLKHSPDAYSNCWPRDASYAAMVFWKLGYIDEVKQFMRFAKDALSSEGFFWPAYRPDSTVGPNPHGYLSNGESTLPIQADETATVLFLMSKVIKRDIQRGGRLEDWREFYDGLIRPAASFLSDYIDPATNLPRPSYELWEVNHQTTTYTTAATFGALAAAAEIAELFGEANNISKWRDAAEAIKTHTDLLWNVDRQYFYRGLVRHQDGQIDYDTTIDASAFYGAWVFGLFDMERIRLAVQTMMNHFDITDDAVRVPRFDNDDYQRTRPDNASNPWFITSFWLAQYRVLNPDSASSAEFTKKVLDWADRHMNHGAVLSEQVDSKTDEALSAAPLAWSHAEFINTCLSYGQPASEESV